MVVISHLAYLLTVVTTTVVLQVGNPALHVFYRLKIKVGLLGKFYKKLALQSCL